MSEGILKIQYGKVFIQLPIDDLDNLEFAKDFLEYWINKSKKPTLSAIKKEAEG